MTEPKPYLSLEEVASLTPFSTQAIRMYVHRGDLREGEHFFRKGRRLVFKWEAICAWIEGRSPTQPTRDPSVAPIEPTRDIVPVRRRA